MNFHCLLIIVFVAVFSRPTSAELIHFGVPASQEIPRIFGRPQLPEVPREFSLLVWNLHKETEDSRFRQDFNGLVEISDFVLAQEVLINKPKWNFLENLSRKLWLFATAFFWRPEIPTGVMTGSRIQAENWGFLKSSGREPFTETPKMAIWSTYKSGPNKSLLVANIHSLNFVKNKVHREQLAELFSVIEKHKGPVILGGDFNTWNKWRWEALMSMAQSHGLQRVNWDRRKSSPLFDFLFYRDLNLKISHCFESVESSDHYPLWAKFSLQPSR